MALARVKVWNPGDTLTASDLNSEFNNLLNNSLSLISPLTGNLNVNENQLLGARLENLTADPAAASANIGRVFVNTAAGSVGLDLGSSQAGGVTFPISPLVEAGCRLVAVTSSQSALNPYKGNRIPIKTGAGWDYWALGSTGLTLSTTSSGITTGGTLYNIFVYNNSGALALVASTAPHATSTETGVEIASTDSTRTFVGLVYTSTSTAAGSPFFIGPPANGSIGTRSWFNRPSSVVGISVPASLSSSLAQTGVGSVVSVVVFSDDFLSASVAGGVFSGGTLGGQVNLAYLINGSPSAENATLGLTNTTANFVALAPPVVPRGFSEGLVTIQTAQTNTALGSALSTGTFYLEVGVR